MAAEDALSPRLFHGTSAKFKPGDLIHPNHLPDMTDQRGHRDFVWSTTSLRDADWYARHRAVNNWHGSNEPHVYEVEHTGLMNRADNPDQIGKHRSAHVSLAPMRVVGEVPHEERAESDPNALRRRGR